MSADGPAPDAVATGLTATVSVSMKVNLGNYESAEAFLNICGITPQTTEADVDELLDGPARIAYDALKVRLAQRVRELREKR